LRLGCGFPSAEFVYQPMSLRSSISCWIIWATVLSLRARRRSSSHLYTSSERSMVTCLVMVYPFPAVVLVLSAVLLQRPP